ncbi:MAG: hypothetical protein ABI700_16015 [Chloroflexota bacterium]
MTSDEIRRLCEHTEAESWAVFFENSPAEFAMQVGMCVRRFSQGIVGLACRGIDWILFNRVMGLGVDAPATEAKIDEIIADYRDSGIARFAFQIFPDAQVEDWLIARGFTRGGEWAKCYRPAVPPDPVATDLRITKIGVDARSAFAHTLCVGSDLPEFIVPLAGGMVGYAGWHSYMAFDGDQPAGTGAVYVQGKVGWLGGGATLPTYRRRGGQGALMTRRIQEGIALGCDWLVTETRAERPDHPNPSYHNMLRTGFQLAYLRTDYLSPAP